MVSSETLRTIPKQCNARRVTVSEIDFSNVSQLKLEDFPYFPATSIKTEDEFKGETSSLVTDNVFKTIDNRERVMENVDDRRVPNPLNEPTDFKFDLTQAVLVKTEGEDEKKGITNGLVKDDSFSDSFETDRRVPNPLNEPTDFKFDLTQAVLVKTEGEDEKKGITNGLVKDDSFSDSFETAADSCEETETERFNGLEGNVLCLLEEPTNFKQLDFSAGDVFAKTEDDNDPLVRKLVDYNVADNWIKIEADHEEMAAECENSFLTNNLGCTVGDDSVKIESDDEEMAKDESGLRGNASVPLNSLTDDFSQNVLWIKTEEQEKEILTACKFAGHFLSGFEDVESDAVKDSNISDVVEVVSKVPVKVRRQQTTSPKTGSKDRTSKELYRCNVCQRNCSSKSGFENHMNTHSGKKRFKCQFCPEKFSSRYRLKDHLMAHNNRRVFGCPHCTAGFNMWSHWRKHLKCHPVKRPVSLARFPCPLCPLEIKSKKYYIIHMKWHSRKKPFKCDDCPLKFSSEQSLKQHLSVHGTHITSFRCPDCSAKFSVKSKLSKHLKSHSLKEPAVKRHSDRKFKCKLCPEKFSRKPNLKDHLLAHENKRRLRCPHCTASFNLKMNLTRHLKCHSL